MIVSDSQKRKLHELFDALPSSVKGHCLRTGIYLQFFFDTLIISSPDLFATDDERLNTSDISLCAREFGFYHHIADKYSSGGGLIAADRETVDNVVGSVFEGAWNSGSFYVRGLIDTVGTHAERWDGSGVPCGISGQDIPFWGRMCAIAERYDVLRSPPYALSPRRSMQKISALSGKSFDPELVDVFLRCSDSLRVLKP